METIITFKPKTKLETLRIIYDYCHQNFLTNPECSFINEREALSNAKTYSMMHNRFPNDFKIFNDEISNLTWDTCLCVAGTDVSDIRRVVLTYSKRLNLVSVNFANARICMTSNEEKIKNWLINIFKY